ncbi:hypothetical protein HBI25_033340 [Parastagonospora nodorum]|nr:hypothetical protein HBI95_061450 [Parastagonospora nodorum]KAH4267535.1 hypothetical protein HBI03_065320 [Parastagonospora nodorum]KAH4273211.1 hypothetical protein HBI04_135140 [Parastagonospora nodorum]KAH4376743.1 hypothetical protein HBH97_112970 [Parastagonospora nodorum]KAH5071470.1 hypothetical protein HBH95_177550 [Parastagonospora nodorum]
MASHELLEVRKSRVLNTAKARIPPVKALSQEGRDQRTDLDSNGAAESKHIAGCDAYFNFTRSISKNPMFSNSLHSSPSIRTRAHICHSATSRIRAGPKVRDHDNLYRPRSRDHYPRFEDKVFCGSAPARPLFRHLGVSSGGLSELARV